MAGEEFTRAEVAVAAGRLADTLRRFIEDGEIPIARATLLADCRYA